MTGTFLDNVYKCMFVHMRTDFYRHMNSVNFLILKLFIAIENVNRNPEYSGSAHCKINKLRGKVCVNKDCYNSCVNSECQSSVCRPP